MRWSRSPRIASAATYRAAAPCMHGSARLAQRRHGSVRGWRAAAPMHAISSPKRGGGVPWVSHVQGTQPQLLIRQYV